MEPPTSGEENIRHGKPSGEKIAISPRKENLVGGEPSPRLHLVPEEQVWERENRIRPKAPKIPFQDPLKTMTTPSVLPHVKSRAEHRFLHFFRSRRKGRYRVINFIVLPIAVLVTFFLIFCMIKFL